MNGRTAGCANSAGSAGSPVLLHADTDGHTQDRQHKENSAAKEDCSVLLGKSERAQSVTGRARPRTGRSILRPRSIVTYFWEGPREPPIVAGSGIVTPTLPHPSPSLFHVSTQDVPVCTFKTSPCMRARRAHARAECQSCDVSVLMEFVLSPVETLFHNHNMGRVSTVKNNQVRIESACEM